jgi:hypothetical protein
MKTAGAVLFAGALLFAAPALAQYYPTQPPPGPPPPPPGYYPPPPPPGYYPPPPPRYYPPQPYWDGKTHFTIRASGGVSFIGAGYYCGYYNNYPGFVNYGCGAGYSSVEPDVNLDLDIWFRPSFGITLGTNVMWGSYTSGGTFASVGTISSTTWEPHVDFLFAPSYVANDQWKGRLRVGFGLYVADANNGNTGTGPTNYNNVGGAFRVGLGASILPKSVVGIGIDAIFEGGWIGSNYVSTVQLLIGPELHF